MLKVLLFVEASDPLQQLPLLTAAFVVDEVAGEDFLELAHGERVDVPDARQVRQGGLPAQHQVILRVTRLGGSKEGIILALNTLNYDFNQRSACVLAGIQVGMCREVATLNSSMSNMNLETELNNFCFGVQVTPVLSVCGGQDDATEGVDWVWSVSVTVHLWQQIQPRSPGIPSHPIPGHTNLCLILCCCFFCCILSCWSIGWARRHVAIGLEEEIKLSPAVGFWREINSKAVSLQSLTSARTGAGARHTHRGFSLSSLCVTQSNTC